VGLVYFGIDYNNFKTLSTLVGIFTIATPYEGGVQVATMIFFLIDNYLAPGKKFPITK